MRRMRDGIPLGMPGTTNMLRIARLGSDAGPALPTE